MTMAEAVIERALAHCSESFITATGPGGQNVNKVATAVQLRVSVYALRLSPEAMTLPEKRSKSRLNRVGKVQRLAGKKIRSSVKAGRGKVRLD